MNQADRTPPTTTAPASSEPASKPVEPAGQPVYRPEFVPPPRHLATPETAADVAAEATPQPPDNGAADNAAPGGPERMES